jgi:hypothetical protein
VSFSVRDRVLGRAVIVGVTTALLLGAGATVAEALSASYSYNGVLRSSTWNTGTTINNRDDDNDSRWTMGKWTLMSGGSTEHSVKNTSGKGFTVSGPAGGTIASVQACRAGSAGVQGMQCGGWG